MRKTLLAAVLMFLCPVLLAAQDALTNDSVVKMLKAGLSEDVVLSAINSKPGNYNTSVDGMIALKAAGASDKVISAMVLKGSGAASAPAAAPAAAAGSALPPGIDEVGVYYQDKTGAWVALMPEVVNFKTGGVLKSFATNGLMD